MAQVRLVTRAAARDGAAPSPVDRPRRLRVRIYLAIFVVATFIVLVDLILLGPRAVLPALLAALAGAALGLVASRMTRLSFDTASGRIVGRLDLVGALVLVGYLVATAFRDQLISLSVAAPYVGVCGVAALAGTMAGQLAGTVRGLVRVARLAGLGPRVTRLLPDDADP